MVHLMNMLWRAFQSSWQRAREKILLCEPIQIVTLFRVDHQDYKLCQIIKISKQGGADTDKLDPGLEQYVRDAHKAAREAAKQKLLVPGSDNSTGSEHVEAGSDIDEID
jgi:hypothetical protein